MAREANVRAHVHDIFWHKSHPCPMTLKFSACVDYPWITFAKLKESKKKVSAHGSPANKSRQA